jgi:NitT/TauT family transport system permease protein
MEKTENQVRRDSAMNPGISLRERAASLPPGIRRALAQCLSLGLFAAVWKVASNIYNSQLLLPTPESTLVAFCGILVSPEMWSNLGLTLKRVLTGVGWAVGLGVPLGFAMGLSKIAMDMLDPLLGSVRQVPIMAWIPLSIIWFGLGDGPTVFIIALMGLFSVVLNTISGVKNIPKDYYHAARSMGAGPWGIFLHIVLPGSMPDIMTGARLALSGGWMAVICAEFIATSAGFGFLMVEAQTRMETEKLLALMVLGAFIGYLMDRVICVFANRITLWKSVS